ncbi:sigma-54-dependent transcriptional regulator [Wenyingzhuangia sp. IMCC45574]
MTNAHILIIDDNKSVLSALEILLIYEYKKVSCLSNPNRISSFADLKSVDVVLLDMNFSAGVNTGNEGLFWLNEIQKQAPDASVILMTAFGAIDLAVNAIKKGATDFILKPWHNQKLLTTIKSALDLRKSKAEINKLKNKENQLKSLINPPKNIIVGNSKALNKVLSVTRKVAQTDVNVLITGENGTGKELIAKELHQHSQRSTEVFVSVDMGSISESLFESELFGHVKGSFTDAKEDRIGKFEAANGGTLFLDEIGNLSLSMQSKLLRAIQDRVIVKVGSNQPIPVDIRLVCATNANLIEKVQEGSFREDLLYRINTIHLEIPSLKERENDILILADFFMKKFTNKYNKQPFVLNTKAQKKLLAHNWPGNIRELQHTMERAVILCEELTLTDTDFLLNTTATTTLETNCKTIEEMEHRMIANALNKHEGNYSAAATELGITRQTLYNKVKKTIHK